MVLLGAGMGPAIPLYTLAIQNAADIRQMGVATSTAVFARGVGATVGLAVLGTVFASALARGVASGVDPRLAFTDAIRLLYLLSAVIAAVALALTIILPALPLRRHLSPPPAASE